MENNQKKKLFGLIDWKRLHKLANEIKQNKESYHTGLASEWIIVGGYKTMKLPDLLRLRVIINNVIHQKKEQMAKELGYARYKMKLKEIEENIQKDE